MTCSSIPAGARLRARVAAWESEIRAQQVVLAALRLALLMRKAGFDPGEPRNPAGCGHISGRWTCGGGNSGGGVSSHILKNPMSYAKQSYKNEKGHTECVTFAQKVGGASLTKYWKPGAAISPSAPPPVGTWVATFVDGKFYGHVGVFMGYDPDGTPILLDQFNSKGEVGIQRYRPKPQPFYGRISNDPTKYCVVLW